MKRCHFNYTFASLGLSMVFVEVLAYCVMQNRARVEKTGHENHRDQMDKTVRLHAEHAQRPAQQLLLRRDKEDTGLPFTFFKEFRKVIVLPSPNTAAN